MEGGHLRDLILSEYDHPQQPQSHEYEGRTEQRVDLADDLVDGQQRRHEVVYDDDCDPPPVRHGGDHLTQNTRGRAQEHHSHQYEQQHREYAHKLPRTAAQIAADDLGDAQAVVADEYDARDEVVHGAHEYSAEGYPEEGHGTEAGAHDGAEDGAYAGDVEQLYEERTPQRHGNIVHAVAEAFGGHLGRRVYAADPLQIAAIGEICRHKEGQTDEKSYHRVGILSVSQCENNNFSRKTIFFRPNMHEL